MYLIRPAEESELERFGVSLDDEAALVLSESGQALALDYDAEALRCHALCLDPAADIRYAV